MDCKPSSFLGDFIKKFRGSKKTPASTQMQAGEHWKIEDDLRLRELFMEGTPIVHLAKEFNRTYGSIRARLKKLGLTE